MRRCRCSAGSVSRTATSSELLYREMRALRIYEGASEVQKLIIAKQVFSEIRNSTSYLGRMLAQPAQETRVERIVEPLHHLRSVACEQTCPARDRRAIAET